MKDLFILVGAMPSEAIETMVELCSWPSIVLVRKLAMYWDILRMTDSHVLALR
jgi:hypothetical protein